MRWKGRRRYARGDTQIRRRFLWWPVRLGDEVRWLEFITVKEETWCHMGDTTKPVWNVTEFLD